MDDKYLIPTAKHTPQELNGAPVLFEFQGSVGRFGGRDSICVPGKLIAAAASPGSMRVSVELKTRDGHDVRQIDRDAFSRLSDDGSGWVLFGG